MIRKMNNTPRKASRLTARAIDPSKDGVVRAVLKNSRNLLSQDLLIKSGAQLNPAGLISAGLMVASPAIVFPKKVQ